MTYGPRPSVENGASAPDRVVAEQHPGRFLLYSHDSVGLGHIRRNLAIASALVQRAPDSSVLLVTGNAEAERLGVDAGIDFLKLPGLRKRSSGGYTARRLAVTTGARPDLSPMADQQNFRLGRY